MNYSLGGLHVRHRVAAEQRGVARRAVPGEVSTRAQTYSGTGKVGDVWKSANFVGVDDVCCWHIASFRCCAAIWSYLE